MHIVKSVGAMSVAKIMGLIYGCMGLIFAPLFLLIGLLGSMAGPNKSPLASLFGVGFAIFMPLLYGGMGFLVGAIGALLYNLFARLVGGFELEIEVRPTGVTAPYPVVSPPTPGI
jgi:hypothetical protein